MNSRIMFTVFVGAILSSSVFGTLFVTPTSASTTHHVYPGQSIQEAINSAQPGDTIFVHEGTYFEQVVINRTISLVGENPGTTLIDGEGLQNVLKIVNRNVNVTGFRIQNANEGIYLTEDADFCIIKDCMIIKNGFGIYVKSDNNLLSKNQLANNSEAGIEMYSPCGCLPVRGNVVTKNELLNNTYGIILTYSLGGGVYHNNFVNNQLQVLTLGSYTNWDNKYPSGGNYWSNYDEVDICSGPHQDQNGSDGILDVPFVIDGSNKDNYPLAQPYHGPVRNLNTGHSYPTIQGAINDATEGDSIFVCSGIYSEHLIINKSLLLNGENKRTTIIDGNNTDYSVRITSSDVELKGFTVRNGHLCDVRVHENVSGVLIADNIILTSEWGIYLGSCTNNTVKRNIVKYCLEGIFLESSSHNLIITNIFAHNHNGIFLTTALHLPEFPPPPPSKFNTIYQNNFINNTLQVQDYGSGNMWDNGSEGNYWSDYNGSDLDSDGIGETELPWEGVDYYPSMRPYRAGDVNYDGIVNIYDVVMVCGAYGSTPDDSYWNSDADIAKPYGKINIYDVVAVCSNYGKTYS